MFELLDEAHGRHVCWSRKVPRPQLLGPGTVQSLLKMRPGPAHLFPKPEEAQIVLELPFIRAMTLTRIKLELAPALSTTSCTSRIGKILQNFPFFNLSWILIFHSIVVNNASLFAATRLCLMSQPSKPS